MSIDELEVKTRHKRKLATIREKEDVSYNGKHDNGDKYDRGYPETAVGSIQTDSGENGEIARTLGSGTQGMENGARDSRGYDQRVRPFDAASFTSDTSVDRSGNTARKLELEQLTPDERADRERELARQRKQRQRDRDREIAALLDEDISSSMRDRDGDERDIQSHRHGHEDVTQPSRFTLKNPLKHLEIEGKLFTSKEIDERKEHLTFVYFKGSGLIDEILEIIVKGHEPVSIWQLDEGEAEKLAEMHLEQAKTDKVAARSARVLLSLYKHIFILMLAIPRAMRTHEYVREQGGLSFR